MNRRVLLESGCCSVASAALGRAGNSSKKKGFGIDISGLEPSEWLSKVKALNVEWVYTWGDSTPQPMPPGIEFVPMIWGQSRCTPAIIKTLSSAGHKSLLGFNEPDHANQSNIPVEKALELWPILQQSGLRLGSPGTVTPEDEWLSVFMKEADKRGYRVDFITVHHYGGRDVKAFMDRLEAVHQLYKRPLWITEFAVADWNADRGGPNRHSMGNVLRYMEAVLPELEKADYVDRYAWYSTPKGARSLMTSSLFNEDGSLSQLGQLYASF